VNASEAGSRGSEPRSDALISSEPLHLVVGLCLPVHRRDRRPEVQLRTAWRVRGQITARQNHLHDPVGAGDLGRLETVVLRLRVVRV